MTRSKLYTLQSPDGYEEKLVCNETVSKLHRGHTNHVMVDVLNLTEEEKVLGKGTVIVHSVSSVLPMTKLFNTDVDRKRGVEYSEAMLEL